MKMTHIVGRSLRIREEEEAFEDITEDIQHALDEKLVTGRS